MLSAYKSYFYLLCILLCNIFNTVLAQENSGNQIIDSLLVCLKTAHEDTNKVDVLTELSFEYSDEGNVKEALNYASKSVELSQKIKFKAGEARAYHSLGSIYSSQGNYQIALNYFQQSLEIKKQMKDLKGIANTTNNIGSIYVYQGDLPQALSCFMSNLKIREQMQDKVGIAEAYNNIGNVYVYLKDYKKALEFLRKSLKLKEEIGDKKKIVNSINNIATVLCYQDSFTQSLVYYKHALEINEEIGSKKGISLTYNNIANLYCDMYEYRNTKDAIDIRDNVELRNVAFINALDSSIILHIKALNIQQQIGDNATRIYSLMGIGKCFHLKKNYKQAIKYYEQAYFLADTLKAVERQEAIAEKLVDVYSKSNDFKSALDWQLKYNQHKDSLNNEDKTAEITRTEMNYEFDKKEAIAKIEQKRKDEKAQHESNVQKLFILLISIGFILVLVFAVYIFKSLKIRNAQNKIISEQKQIVEIKQKEVIDSITYAKNIQNAMLPSKDKWYKLLPQSFVFYLPKDIVAGDFYWVERIEQFIFVAAADCTGHGVPGAMVSVVCNNALNRAISEFKKQMPGDILDKTRDLVVESFSKNDDDIVKDGMDISLACIDTKNNKVYWSGANNPLWIYRKHQHRIDEIKANKQPIGKGYDQLPFTTNEVNLDQGDVIYLFTDGYADQFGGNDGKKMTKKRFRSLLLEIGNKPIPAQLLALQTDFTEFKATHEQIDDICVIGIQVLPQLG
jgi:tetratricopeptide (TPR) repeat protein